MPAIEKVAAIILDSYSNLLCVKKKGLEAWISPGGKIDIGESHADCLRRELKEELNVTLGFSIKDLQEERPYLTCRGIAEGTTDTELTIHFYHAYLVDHNKLKPCNEIEYYVWAPLNIYNKLPLAWTLKQEVMPKLFVDYDREKRIS